MPELTIDTRFNGPPDSGNGGYVAGRLAALLGDTAAAEVTLRLPPPLGRPLQVRADGDGLALHDGDALIASARAADPTTLPEPPAGVELDAARAAAAASPFREPDAHPFPACFGCGPLRGDDAVHALAGPVAGRPDLYATDWTPGARLPLGADGRIEPAVAWAALDCPSSFPVTVPGRPAVLGRMAARLDRPIEPGAPCVVLAWALERGQGRRHESASALLSADGTLLGVARATWIELR